MEKLTNLFSKSLKLSSSIQLSSFSTSSSLFLPKWPQLSQSIIQKYTPTPQNTPEHHHNDLIGSMLKNELNDYPPFQSRKLTKGWQDHRMMRDYRKRTVAYHYAPLRARLIALKRNKILPEEIKDMASVQISSLPRDSNWTRIKSRCVLTSKRRGCKIRWGISRIMWRHFADYNKLSGVLYSRYLYSSLQKRKHLVWPPPEGLSVAEYSKRYHDDLADKSQPDISVKSFVKLT